MRESYEVLKARAIYMGRLNKRYNKYDLSGDYGVGYTSNTNEQFYFDLEDYDKIKDYCWRVHHPSKIAPEYKTLSAYDPNTKKVVKFWWVVFGKNADHINNNTLDNRKSNLRLCTEYQNHTNLKLKSNNTSGVSGVCLSNPGTSHPRWRARIMVRGKEIKLGYFEDFNDAVIARLIGEYKYFGDFAPQKHLWEKYGLTQEIINERIKE